jgi:D-arabinitol 4-dehydrogenase
VFMRHADAGVIPFKYIEPKWDWISPMLAKGQEESFAREAELWGDIPERCPEFVTSLVAEIEQLDHVFAVQAEGVTV